MPLNDLEGQFLLFETILTPILRETWHKFANIARRAVFLR